MQLGPGLIPRQGRSPGEANGNPLQYSCLGNPKDEGAWWATVHNVAQELDTTKRLHFDFPGLRTLQQANQGHSDCSSQQHLLKLLIFNFQIKLKYYFPSILKEQFLLCVHCIWFQTFSRAFVYLYMYPQKIYDIMLHVCIIF